ncbi:predicted protein [Postia placenta Mad-698-R]|uniref:C2H2-type domain-containing protein n=1 Tax=Postia placenta MAD-698-R-SB12 TaxID=670580 RepID=A0A1X6N3G4_9APHY|nr:hypothetical protein POSPLADRAFT_1139793 [Postia placenta MAD-698-R-SB12]EED78221.1 predicted protein [Postia placenta Mad-698-R]OSX63169.1 hypothetical protein POSPLADRAFT_1139793 [Postia placenta MAD-698-R-SB12]
MSEQERLSRTGRNEGTHLPRIRSDAFLSEGLLYECGFDVHNSLDFDPITGEPRLEFDPSPEVGMSMQSSLALPLNQVEEGHLPEPDPLPEGRRRSIDTTSSREDTSNISFAHAPGPQNVGQDTNNKEYTTCTEGGSRVHREQDGDAANARIVPTMCRGQHSFDLAPTITPTWKPVWERTRPQGYNGPPTVHPGPSSSPNQATGPTRIQPSRAAKGEGARARAEPTQLSAGGVDQETPRAVKRKGDPIGGDEKRSRSSQGEASSSAQPRRDVVPRLSLPPTQNSTASSLPVTTKAPRDRKPQEKKYRCTNCNKPKATFSAEYELNRHVKQCTNPGARPYKCWICPQKANGELVGFDRHDALRRHFKTKHPGERPPSKRDLN